MMLPFDFSTVLSAFGYPDPLPVRETEGAYNGPRWQEKELEGRTIRAVVLQLRPQDLQILAQGNASDGGISLMTEDTLYWSDIDKGGTCSRQSYVTYQGYEFRVIGSGFTKGNTTFNTYNALRFHDDRPSSHS